MLALVAQALCNGALLKGISGAYLGKDTSVGEAYRFVLPRLLSLIGAAIMVGLVVNLGFVLLIVPGIIFALMYALTSQAIVCENLGAFKGMTRSSQLSKGSKGKIFWLSLVVALITMAAWGIFYAVSQLFQTTPTMANVQDVRWSNLVIESSFELVGSALIAPIAAGAFILLYYDLRIRKEGFDLEMLAQSMGEQAAEQATEQPPLEPPVQ